MTNVQKRIHCADDPIWIHRVMMNPLASKKEKGACRYRLRYLRRKRG